MTERGDLSVQTSERSERWRGSSERLMRSGVITDSGIGGREMPPQVTLRALAQDPQRFFAIRCAQFLQDAGHVDPHGPR